MAGITLDRVSKRFADGTVAVNDVSLSIADGEFFILVGPSGCGKSTLLNMIVGLEDVSAGEIRVDEQRVNEVDPKDRNMAMVFQSYAIYPHMTVRENMAFPLKLARLPRNEIARRVEQAADMLELRAFLDRKPRSLSGGQRQRVAMGRAMVREPRAFLLDEPLSNLDAKLRVQMRTEIARLQRRLGTTTLYVTHDQTEAMTLGDRIAVLRHGELQQLGTPRELYRQPRNLFVAGFIGSPAMNFFPAELRDNQWIELPMGKAPLPEKTRRRLPAAQGVVGHLHHRPVRGDVARLQVHHVLQRLHDPALGPHREALVEPEVLHVGVGHEVARPRVGQLVSHDVHQGAIPGEQRGREEGQPRVLHAAIGEGGREDDEVEALPGVGAEEVLGGACGQGRVDLWALGQHVLCIPRGGATAHFNRDRYATIPEDRGGGCSAPTLRSK